MKIIKTYEAYKSAFKKFMLEWKEFKDGEWYSSNTLITTHLSEINDYIDSNNLTMKENEYTIKGWRNNKWEVLVYKIKK